MSNRYIKSSYITPTTAFYWSVIGFNLIPALIMWMIGYNEGLYFEISDGSYADATLMHIRATVAMIICFFLGHKLHQNAFAKISDFRIPKIVSCRTEYNTLAEASIIYRLNRSSKTKEVLSIKLVFVMGVLGILCICLYCAFGGLQKLFLYGSALDSLEYRLIGFDDRSRLLIALLEFSRRILLPFSAIYFLRLAQLSKRGILSNNFNVAVCLFLFLGGIVTLDRAPILLFVVMFAYLRFSDVTAKRRELIVLVFLTPVILFVGGLTTYLQYNIQEFSVKDIFLTGYDFLFHRTFMVPSIASIELGFNLFDWRSEKLYLAHSRLMALFGKEYVGTTFAKSIYVTPVGFIADIWRNFGASGLVVVGSLLGVYFSWVSTLCRHADPIVRTAVSFTVISLCFYFIFGLFFSQGVFAQLIFLPMVLKLTARDSLDKVVGY